MNPLIIAVLLMALSGCATVPKGYEFADQSRVSANADIAMKAETLSDDITVSRALYWATAGDVNQRILASVCELKKRGGIKRARAAGLSGSDAEVLIGVVLASVRDTHPP